LAHEEVARDRVGREFDGSVVGAERLVALTCSCEKVGAGSIVGLVVGETPQCGPWLVRPSSGPCAHGDQIDLREKERWRESTGETVPGLPRRVARRLAPGKVASAQQPWGTRQATFVRTMPTCVGIVHPPPCETPRTSCTSHYGARSTVPGRLVSPTGATSFRGGTGDGLSACRRPARRTPPAETDGGGGTCTRASPAYWLAELGGRGSLGVGQQRRSPEGGNPERATLVIGCLQTRDAFGTTRREVNRSRLSSVASFGNASRGKTEWTPGTQMGRPLGPPSRTAPCRLARVTLRRLLGWSLTGSRLSQIAGSGCIKESAEALSAAAAGSLQVAARARPSWRSAFRRSWRRVARRPSSGWRWPRRPQSCNRRKVARARPWVRSGRASSMAGCDSRGR